MTEANLINGAQDQKHTDALDKDTIHLLLSNSRRRAILRLLDQRGSIPKNELSTLVAADEYGKEPSNVTSDERKRVHISLHQQHLDKLEDSGVIVSNGEIAPTANMEQLLWYLDGRRTLCDWIKDRFASAF